MTPQQGQPPRQTTPLSQAPSPSSKGKWILITGITGVVVLLAIFVYGMTVLGHNLFKPNPTPVSFASNSSSTAGGETEQGATPAKSLPASPNVPASPVAALKQEPINERGVSGLNSRPLATKPPAAIKPRASQPEPVTATPTPDGGSVQQTLSSPQADAVQQTSPTAAAEEQLNNTSETLVKLHARMDVANQSLATLKQQMAAQGLTLRADIVAAESRAYSYFQMADRAFQGRDLESAQKNIDRTEQELAKIEHFLGR
jgi:hypothetical protein